MTVELFKYLDFVANEYLPRLLRCGLLKYCQHYCGISCVDGACPLANREEYEERCYDLPKHCRDCYRYLGCEDCYFASPENAEMCPFSAKRKKDDK